jgi:HemY protein
VIRGLFWLLALFGLAAVVALAARYNDGYALLVLPPYRLEVSLNLLLGALLLGFVATYALVRSVVAVIGLPARVAAYRARMAREKAMALFLDAFRLLFEGRFGQAMKKAAEAHRAGIAPGLSALIAARAAQRLRRPGDQQAWLDRATEDDRQATAARLMLEAEMHLDGRDFDAAVGVLEQLQKVAGRHLAALRLELKARQGAGQWDEVLRLARLLEKRDALVPEIAAELKLRAHLESVDLRRSDTRALLGYLRGVPDEESGPRLAVAVASALIELEAWEEAARVIEGQLEREWDGKLVALYGQCREGRALSRIAEAEKWLQKHPDDAQLLLALGRLCFAQRLWGKCQSYLDASLAVAETRDAHLELARLYDALERSADADRQYRLAAKPALCVGR